MTMDVVLVSTYDLGRQPFGLASPAAFLRRAGHRVTCVDVTRTKLAPEAVRDAGLIAFFLPMHTATRLALPLIDRVRTVNPSARLCAYGLYAPLNEDVLRQHGVQTILGPEFEEDLVSIAGGAEPAFRPGSVDRVTFIAPDRSDLPPLSRYAALQVGNVRKIVGYTEATRGCKHRCRHCPIVPVYDGLFRIVPKEVVLEDIRRQVAAGAEHITFGDPDFFNGPLPAAELVRALHREWPQLSYDVTIKVEHLLKHRELLPLLKETGCAFVTSAVEAIDDRVLALLDKGHTRADFERLIELMRDTGLPLSPTFVAFTPWTTVEGYAELLRAIADLGMVNNVAPVQYAIRLLIPGGSRLLELHDVQQLTGEFDAQALCYPWRHPDPRVDLLQREIEQLVAQKLRQNVSRHDIFDAVYREAERAAGKPADPWTSPPLRARASIPYLTEPWYC